jgi:hypothetical protein
VESAPVLTVLVVNTDLNLSICYRDIAYSVHSANFEESRGQVDLVISERGCSFFLNFGSIYRQIPDLIPSEVEE